MRFCLVSWNWSDEQIGSFFEILEADKDEQMEDCKFGGSLWKKLSYIWNEGCKTSPRLCSQVKCGALRTAVVLFFQGKSLPSVSPCSFSPVFFYIFSFYVFFTHQSSHEYLYYSFFSPHHLWQVCVHKESHYHLCLITHVLMHFVTRICDSRLRLEADVVRGCKWPQIKRFKSHFGGLHNPPHYASTCAARAAPFLHVCSVNPQWFLGFEMCCKRIRQAIITSLFRCPAGQSTSPAGNLAGLLMSIQH